MEGKAKGCMHTYGLAHCMHIGFERHTRSHDRAHGYTFSPEFYERFAVCTRRSLERRPAPFHVPYEGFREAGEKARYSFMICQCVIFVTETTKDTNDCNFYCKRLDFEPWHSRNCL